MFKVTCWDLTGITMWVTDILPLTDVLNVFFTQVSNRVFSYFLPSGVNIPFLLQSSLARLANAMASSKVGRDYLSSYTVLVETLVDCLIFVGAQMEDFTLEMIIATLQKLSLK